MDSVTNSDLSSIEYHQLKQMKKDLLQMKRDLRRKIDRIDTDLIGIKEEIRKREDKGLEGQIYPNGYTPD